jgi:hypothetical protein
MKRQEIDGFFKEVAKRIEGPIKVYITGGIAAWLLGGTRPTQDIDFALKSKSHWEQAELIINEVSRELKIPVQYAEDISRWGMIGVRSFEKNARLYKKFGHVSIYVLDPLIWSIGKISRYTADDINDMKVVFKKQKVKALDAVKVWARALKESPRSSEQYLFVRKVEDFLKHVGPKIWLQKYDHTDLFERFKRLAAIR